MIGELVVYGLVFVAVMIFMRGKRENLNSVSGVVASIMNAILPKLDAEVAAAKAAVDSMSQVVNPAADAFQKYGGKDTSSYTAMNSYANEAVMAANSAKQLTDAVRSSTDFNYVKQNATSIPGLRTKAETNATAAKNAAPAVMASAQSAKTDAEAKAAADAAAAKAAADAAAAKAAADAAARAAQPAPAAPTPTMPVSTPAPVGPSPSMASGSAYAASCTKCLLVNNQLSCSCDVTPR